MRVGAKEGAGDMVGAGESVALCAVGAAEIVGAGDTVEFCVVGAAEIVGAGETVPFCAVGANEGAGEDVEFPGSVISVSAGNNEEDALNEAVVTTLSASLLVTKAAESSETRIIRKVCSFVSCMAEWIFEVEYKGRDVLQVL
ncbi:MAG: hypothetical protein SGILL_007951 [Bacillariaceae sp.]